MGSGGRSPLPCGPAKMHGERGGGRGLLVIGVYPAHMDLQVVEVMERLVKWPPQAPFSHLTFLTRVFITLGKGKTIASSPCT